MIKYSKLWQYLLCGEILIIQAAKTVWKQRFGLHHCSLVVW